LEKYEHVCQYRGILEHALYRKLEELLMNVVDQKLAKIELCSGLLLGGEYG